MTVCLTMIVRNEAPVIRRCLASVRPHVDAWAIVDTGSTDGTQDLVREAMVGLPGELHERPWVDFAHNRTEALELARASGCDWTLTIDADEELVAPAEWAWPELDADAYQLEVRPEGSADFSFTRHLLLRSSTPWRYHGVVHEDITCDVPARLGGVLAGPYVLTRRDGARQRNPRKYLDDAALLLADLARSPNPRTAFYVAQSYRDHWVHHREDRDALVSALHWYTERAKMTGGWDQETWLAGFEVARCKELLGYEPREVIESYLAAFATRPQRAESLANLARYMRLCGQPAVADVFAAYASQMSVPASDQMYLDRACYAGLDARIGIITAPREGLNALHFTLWSVLSADALDVRALRVFSDSVTAPACSVPVETEAQEELDRRREAGGIYGTLNLARALEWASGARDLAVTLEDDVMASRGWLRRGRLLLEAAEAQHGGSVVVSLHDMHAREVFGPPAVVVGTDTLCDLTRGAYPNGSQGYLMRPATAAALARELRERMSLPAREERKAWAMDVGVTRICAGGLARIMFADPCLLLHIDGARTTWADGPEGMGVTDEEHRAMRKTRRARPW